jgi:predicted CoA-binding protein
MKKTLVLGASENPERYGYKATQMLLEYGHEVIPFALKKGQIHQLHIVNQLPQNETIDTVTLYLNPKNQEGYRDYILSLKPRRVIFNPGTENPDFEKQLEENGIQALEACTLVLLRTGRF